MIGSMNWAVEWFRADISPPEHLAEAMKKLFFDGAKPQTKKTSRTPSPPARQRKRRE
jgi:hypothetical protein